MITFKNFKRKSTNIFELLKYDHSQIPVNLACKVYVQILFPWPYQPYQCFDENTERVALQRRCTEDDQFAVPHNIYLTMFSSSSVNVMAFDPHHGADRARSYATKYGSKPEKWPSVILIAHSSLLVVDGIP